ncbi:MAG: hypothetical protein Kow0029_28400 [Candidatus Rifleibacteriota bacterium]
MTKDNNKSLPFTLAFRIPSSFRRYISTCNRKIIGVCRSLEPLDTAHLTVKFLGHSSEFLNENTITNYIPKIFAISRKYVPLTLRIRGFSTFSYEEKGSTVIYLKVMPNEKLLAFHNEICESFKDAFISFPHAEGENFEPHITLSKNLLPNKEKQIERIVARSKKSARRILRLEDLVILSPNRMYPITKNITSPLICPPVK